MAGEHFQKVSAAATRPPVIPEHELLRRIGEGAYGEVWLARSITDALRAVKIVYRARFTDERPYEREFNGITKFEPLSRSNEGLVDILQVGRDDQAQCFYYVMELADPLDEPELPPNGHLLRKDWSARLPCPIEPAKYVAHTLRADVQRRGRLPCRECVQLGMSLSLALGHLHRHGLLHRDVKPSNIIFVGGVPKLADIGLVTELSEARSYVGTEGFIPPDGPNSQQADLYSLGKVLYEASMGKDRQEFPEPRTTVLDDPEAPALLELNAVVVKACASERRDRYQSAEEMHADLALLYSGRSVKRKHVLEQRVAWMSKVGPLVTVAAFLATGAYLVQRHQTGEIRRLAQAESLQRERAEIALGQADQSLTELEQERAEEDFAAARAPSGLAGLAHLLRTHPTNRVAAERLLSALTQRNFLLPAVPAITLHTNVVGTEFSQDGRFLVIGCADGSLRLWDTREDGLSELPGLGTVLESIVSSASPEQMVLLGSDHVVRYLDVQRRLYAAPSFTNAASAWLVDVTADGKWLAAAEADGSVRVWNLESREPAGPPLQAVPGLTRILLSPDGAGLFMSGSNFLSQTWDTQTGHPRSLPQRNAFRLAPSFSPNGLRLVLDCDFDSAVVLDAATLQPFSKKLTHGTWLSALHFSPDGERIVTGSGDRTTRVWDAGTGQPLTPPMLHRSLVNSAQFSPEGRRLLVSTLDGTVRVWDAQDGTPLSEPLALSDHMEWARFSPDGERILVLTGGRRLALLDSRPTQALPRVIANDQTVCMAGFSPDDSQLLCVNFSSTAMLWNLRSCPVAGVPLSHLRAINAAEFSPDGRLIATAGDDKAVRLWDAATGRMVGKPILQDAQVSSVQFDAVGKRLITGAADGTARVWEIATGREVGRLQHPSGVRNVAFGADGASAITQAHDQTLRLWKLDPEPKLLRELRHDMDVGFVKSMDGKRLATFSADQTAQVWDARFETPFSPVLKHNNMIISAGLSPDGRRLVTGCRDGVARVWDAASGRSVTMLHEGSVKVAWFSPDARHVVTGADNGIARLWETDSGQPVSEPLAQESDINSARFTSDGKWLTTVSADGAARIWEVLTVTNAAPAWLPDLAEAVANKRLEERHVVLAADDEAFWRVRQAVFRSTDKDEFTQWAKWFFASRATRSASPGASLNHAEWVKDCLARSSPVCLREALRGAPTEPRPIAALVHANLIASLTNTARLAATEWLSQYAVRRWPESGAVWQAQAELLRRSGKLREALAAFQRAIELEPEPSLCLMKAQLLESLGDLAGSEQACGNGLCLLSNSLDCSRELKQRLSFQRINALRQLGDEQRARPELAALMTVPVRDPLATANALDLSLCYNARLDEDWHRHTDLDNNLAGLAPGLHLLNGITFDVRGIVQLDAPIRDLDPLYPERINRIAVSRPCRQLHFLHGTGWTVPDGTTIAHWVVHWTDGREESVPIIHGRDVRDWHFWPTMRRESDGGAQPVWKGPLPRWKSRSDFGVRLYQTTWQNPRPDVDVASIDFVSAGAASAPFLLAITVE